MRRQLFVATQHGILTLELRGDVWQGVGGALDGHHFTSITNAGEALLAGTTDGIYRSEDAGQTWWESSTGLEQRHLRSLAYHPDDPDLAFAGTEPAAIFISEDGGRTWQERPEIAQLREEHGWYLPYSPAAGCIRGFAFRGSRGYAAAEQGGLLRSDNSGQSWQLAGGSTGKPGGTPAQRFIHSDVHSVAIHPSSVDQIWAPTGGGLYYSTDGGDAWSQLHDRYCRAVWVDAVRPAHLVLGTADAADRNGQVEKTINNGDSWELAMGGLPPALPQHMVEQFLEVDDTLLAILSNGELLSSALEPMAWRTVLAAVHDVRAATLIRSM